MDDVPAKHARRSAHLPWIAALIALAASGCIAPAGVGPAADRPLETVDRVDLERFAGLWYVIESRGTGAEAGAHDATERYTMRPDGRIDIDFRFREGGFDGPERRIPQTGWVYDTRTNAEWRVRPFWPLRLAYLVIDLDPDYAWTVIGHPSKRYVWVLAREPRLAAGILDGIHARLAAQGYDTQPIETVPQRPLDERPPLAP